MNLHLFQELIVLNHGFHQVLRSLERMEKVRLFNGDIIRYARAEVESARAMPTGSSSTTSIRSSKRTLVGLTNSGVTTTARRSMSKTSISRSKNVRKRARRKASRPG